MKQPVLLSKKDFAYCAISGLLLGVSFSSTRIDCGMLAWIALVPLFIALDNKPALMRGWLSMFCGFIFFLVTLYWLAHVSVTGLIILCLYLSLYFFVFGLLKAPRSCLLNLVWVPSAWILLEFLRSSLLTGFGWGLLGYTQFKNLLLIQSAALVGVWGVGFVIVLVNVVIHHWAAGRKNSLGKIAGAFGACVLLLAMHVYGYVCLRRDYFAPDINVSVIQGNIPQEQKWDPAYRKLILATFRALTQKAAQDNPGLILWPETSVPGYVLDEPLLLKSVLSLVRDINTFLLIGSPREDLIKKRYYNSAFLFDPRGEIICVHDKIHLVPFGEYIPFKNLLGFLETRVADFSAGKRIKLFTVPDRTGRPVHFAVLICFEDIFPHLVRRFKNAGADFLVIISNEAWFKKSAEPQQHLAMSVFRAVENRCWFIRCANTGISCFIDPCGRVVEQVGSKNKAIFVTGFKTQLLGAGLIRPVLQFDLAGLINN
ncbi:MAG: apolipoprotein N-acyltransferase [Candidatus Omnitrophica bacterium]|nr:apolipoprotein N-acyltransferase [Candidatus Omnitrophota bacterium]